MHRNGPGIGDSETICQLIHDGRKLRGLTPLDIDLKLCGVAHSAVGEYMQADSPQQRLKRLLKLAESTVTRMFVVRRFIDELQLAPPSNADLYDPELRAMGLAVQGMALMGLGDVALAEIAVAKVHIPLNHAEIRLRLGNVALRENQALQAVEEFRGAQQLYAESGLRGQEASAQVGRALGHLLAGQVDEALSLGQQAAALAMASGAGVAAVEALLVIGESLLKKGQPDQALAAFLHASNSCEPGMQSQLRVRALQGLANACGALGLVEPSALLAIAATAIAQGIDPKVSLKIDLQDEAGLVAISREFADLQALLAEAERLIAGLSVHLAAQSG